MDELVRWLGEQLDADADRVRAVRQPEDLGWVARHLAGEEAEGTVRWDVPGVAQPTHEDPLNKARMEHIAAWDPARVLREIEAKRAVVSRYEFACAQAADDRSNSEEEREAWVQVAGALQSCVLCFAAIYADRPGYDEAVRP